MPVSNISSSQPTPAATSSAPESQNAPTGSFNSYSVKVGTPPEPVFTRHEAVDMLTSYHSTMSALKRDNIQPSSSTNNDPTVMPLLIEAENARTEGLNLRYTSQGYEELLGELANLPEGAHQRYVARMGEGSVHHAAVDACKKDGKLSIIVLEPAPIRSEIVVTGVEKLSTALLEQYSGEYELSYLSVQAQASPADCAMFSLSFALKAKDHEALLLDMHSKQLNGEKIGDNGETKNDHYTLYKDASKMLPSSFLKHAHRKTVVSNHLSAHPERKKVKVNKQGETLETRQQHHQVSRSGRDYSASIEDKRITVLERALTYFASKA